ncbi:MAG: ABC-three component system protein [Pseudomonadota bacterium]|nr:ABC-three component system protein [Pseudomonadota bacterium]
MSDMKGKGKAAPKRTYSAKTLKILFALSGNQCAKPGCSEPIIALATHASSPSVIGQIAHIFALSEDGPRGKAGLTEKERNQAANLLLLCPTHHVKIDTQFETYPAPMLLEWKTRHEKKYGEGVSASISDVGYAELEVAARSLLGASASTLPSSLAIIPPQDKIDKNGLGPASTMLLTMGAAKSREVEEMLIKSAQLDPAFPDRLCAAFVDRYHTAKTADLSGDDIFNELYEWVGGAGSDKGRAAAGLCIIAHLFIICDIFEK